MSDKTLMVVAVIAVLVAVVSVVGTFMVSNSLNNWVLGLSPGATNNQSIGIVNVTIAQNLVINFSLDRIQWGSGSVDAGQSNATLDSATSVTALRGSWNRSNTATGGDGFSTPQGFQLQNIGNINATIYLKTDQTAAQFIGGSVSGPEYKFNVSNVETGSCLNSTGGTGNLNLGAYLDVNTTHPGTQVCGRMPFGTPGGAETNTIRIDVLLTIPNNAPTGGPKISNMTATAEIAP